MEKRRKRRTNKQPSGQHQDPWYQVGHKKGAFWREILAFYRAKMRHLADGSESHVPIELEALFCLTLPADIGGTSPRRGFTR